jgi:release factor glutamine methyltransferase
VRPSLLVRRAAGFLSGSGVDAPEATAELLLESVLGTDRAGVYTRGSELSGAEARALGRALCRRSRGVPLEHITGMRGFRGLTLEVRPGTFVPRVETELLVELALGLVEDVRSPVIVDVGTGTGAVALAMARERPGARVLATDLSWEAVELARDNARSLDIGVEVLQGDLLDAVPERLRGEVDLVVSNPPYVPSDRRARLAPEVRRDPPLAVFADPQLLGRLSGQARHWLRPGGGLAIEIDDDRGAQVEEVLRAGFSQLRIERDLTGRERFVLGRRT